MRWKQALLLLLEVQGLLQANYRGSFEGVPEFARYILECKKVRKLKETEVLTIEAYSFPKRNFCFLKQYKCCGGRPCRRCQVAKAICRDVTDDALNEFPDPARHVLELSPQSPVSQTPCRYCVGNGRTFHRANSADSCKACTRYGRPCSNYLEGVKKEGYTTFKPILIEGSTPRHWHIVGRFWAKIHIAMILRTVNKSKGAGTEVMAGILH
jgi:hypothetical protein